MFPDKFYLLLFFWCLGFIFLWKIPFLTKRRPPPSPSPKLSVLIPARNEEHTLNHLLTSIHLQTFKPYEILVIDDQSEDSTAEVAKRNGCSVIPSTFLPEGWTGKNWACWQGAQQASGDLFLFLDADTVFEPESLEKIVYTYLEKKGLVSIQPYHKMEKTYERLSAIFNIITVAGVNAFTLLGSRAKPTGAFGPCMICSREDYFHVGGHQKARDAVLESLVIGKEFLKHNKGVHCFGGKGTLTFRMYPGGLRSLIEGFSKGFGTGARAMSLMSLFIVVCWIFGGMGVTRQLIQSLLVGNRIELLGWLLIDSLYIFQIHWMLSRIGNFGFSTALLFQIPLIFFVLVFLTSFLRIFVLRKVRWKGREVKTGMRKS